MSLKNLPSLHGNKTRYKTLVSARIELNICIAIPLIGIDKVWMRNYIVSNCTSF